jgi:hypothetical protein
MTRTRKPRPSGDENGLRELLEARRAGGEIAAKLNRTISSVFGYMYQFNRMQPIPITIASEWALPYPDQS